MNTYFSKLKDNDFYSDKLTHIYFTSKVHDKSIDELIIKIKDANNIPNPKPILIHICSFGGNLMEGLRFLTILKLSKVPIATIIDNYSCSAATFLSINSPYRVMNKYGFCLLHEYSISGFYNKKREYFLNTIKEIDTYFNIIVNMYLQKTKFTRDELTSLLQHNLFLDYHTCLSKGIVDRVIDVKHPESSLSKLNINNLINNTIDMTHLPLKCETNTSNLDFIIMNNNSSNNKKPYLIYPVHNKCTDNESSDNELKLTSTDVLNELNIFKTLNMIPRIINISNPKIGIIDTPISIDNLLPLLFTDKIYMYKHTFVVCNLIYFYNMNNSILIDDNLKNTKTLMTKVKTILKQKTKMTKQEISQINKKFLILSSKQALTMGLCHEIID